MPINFYYTKKYDWDSSGDNFMVQCKQGKNNCKGGIPIKNIANDITILRIFFAIAMLLVSPFSYVFWVCYLLAGISDILDGIVARGLKQQSDFGAKLDSAADFIFAAAIAVIMIVHVEIPVWLWSGIGIIALCRFLSYVIGYCKYHTFSALHTYANKAVGGILFIFPVMNSVLGITVSGILICAAALFASMEEAVITITSKELDRECRSMFHCTDSNGKG